jgi:small subunit ribosomal protein S8
MTDPIADMLTRIRNASRARHQKVAVPWSRLKESVVNILIEEGYLKEQKRVKSAAGGGDEIVRSFRGSSERARRGGGFMSAPRGWCRFARGSASIFCRLPRASWSIAMRKRRKWAGN